MLKTLWHGSIYRLKGMWGTINRAFYKSPDILDSISSLEKILNDRCSVARFGDGEFNLIRGGELGFQKADALLALKLREVLDSDIKGLDIGLPDVFGDLSEYEVQSARFWKAYMGMHRGEMTHMIDLNRTYLNTNMTRFWSGYRDKNQVKQLILLYKKIWQERNIVFIEGKLTRMGVGNDLFSGAASIQRILCPAKSAWDKYDEILNTIKKLNLAKDTLFILALGPTATVLAYDLTKEGYQALDLGHLDVQYEYSLCNARDKVALEGKYVNENIAGQEVSDSIIDDKYRNSIIAQIN